MPTLTPRSTPEFDASMREALSSFCTGVAVITAIQNDGRPAGMAVQSFSAVSLEPPLICFCPALTSTTWPHIRGAGRFAVNILAAEQQSLCRQFAVTGKEKFQDVGWHPGSNGAPLLDGALATVECDLAGTFPGGDHLIALGRVTALERHGDAGPLLYFRRGYGRLRSSSSRSASIESARSRSDA
ncbi:flavin reductase family protein [Streptomyces sp. SID10853]|uniref:flavin reductase family protein n=1 Tax=Streptomyces sp. SID10853 TaxID=2706028 RepID=UPI0013C04F54|nr:flavin reductase family protein [Streptomyces sp. SID10853]NDZ78105.1 flavin reductase family protein [Streptomyces sp. SID10853]